MAKLGMNEESDDEKKALNKHLANARAMDKKKKPEVDDDLPPRAAEDNDEGEEIEIDGDRQDPDDDDDDDIDDEPRLSRKEKKSRRLDRMIEEGIEKRMREREARQPAPQPQVQQQQGPDPLEAELETVQQSMQGLLAEYNARVAAKNLTPEDEKNYVKRANKLKVDEQRVFNRMATRDSEPQEQVRALHMQIQSRYPDVFEETSKRAWPWMQARYNQLVAEGKPGNWQTADLAARATREKFGIRDPNASRVSEASRQRHTGIGRGAGAAPREGASKSIVMTKEYKKHARSAYPDLYKKDPKLAYQKWVNGAGRTLVRQGQI